VPTEADLRETRRRAIVALLKEERIGRQEQLLAGLRAWGIEATQSSVSRDLRDLGVAKVRGRYVLPAPAPKGAPDARGALAEAAPLLRAIRTAGPHLTIVLTAVGGAPRVGIAIDRQRWPEVAGTVAGDDTVFVATPSSRGQARLVRRLETLRREGGA
jgi:transcriptional regulator of arginine metabolism